MTRHQHRNQQDEDIAQVKVDAARLQDSDLLRKAPCGPGQGSVEKVFHQRSHAGPVDERGRKPFLALQFPIQPVDSPEQHPYRVGVSRSRILHGRQKRRPAAVPHLSGNGFTPAQQPGQAQGNQQQEQYKDGDVGGRDTGKTRCRLNNSAVDATRRSQQPSTEADQGSEIARSGQHGRNLVKQAHAVYQLVDTVNQRKYSGSEKAQR